MTLLRAIIRLPSFTVFWVWSSLICAAVLLWHGTATSNITGTIWLVTAVILAAIKREPRGDA